MKKLIILMILCMAVPAFAAPTINFSQDDGSWDYVAQTATTGTIIFQPIIIVDQGLGDSTDPLVDAVMLIPQLSVALVGTDWVVTPATTTTIEIVDAASYSTIYFTGTLGTGIWDMDPGDTTSDVYSSIASDITFYSVPTQTTPTASPTLSALTAAALDQTTLDLSISLDYGGLDILATVGAGGSIEGGSVSGSMAIVPAPGAILLGSIGVGFVGWLRRRRTL